MLGDAYSKQLLDALKAAAAPGERARTRIAIADLRRQPRLRAAAAALGLPPRRGSFDRRAAGARLCCGGAGGAEVTLGRTSSPLTVHVQMSGARVSCGCFENPVALSVALHLGA